SEAGKGWKTDQQIVNQQQRDANFKLGKGLFTDAQIAKQKAKQQQKINDQNTDWTDPNNKPKSLRQKWLAGQQKFDKNLKGFWSQVNSKANMKKIQKTQKISIPKSQQETGSASKPIDFQELPETAMNNGFPIGYFNNSRGYGPNPFKEQESTTDEQQDQNTFPKIEIPQNVDEAIEVFDGWHYQLETQVNDLEDQLTKVQKKKNSLLQQVKGIFDVDNKTDIDKQIKLIKDQLTTTKNNFENVESQFSNYLKNNSNEKSVQEFVMQGLAGRYGTYDASERPGDNYYNQGGAYLNQEGSGSKNYTSSNYQLETKDFAYGLDQKDFARFLGFMHSDTSYNGQGVEPIEGNPYSQSEAIGGDDGTETIDFDIYNIKDMSKKIGTKKVEINNNFKFKNGTNGTGFYNTISAITDLLTGTVDAGNDANYARTVRLLTAKKGNSKYWSVYAPIPQPNTSSPGPVQFDVSHEILSKEQLQKHYDDFLVDLYFNKAPEIRN
ncbi:MAG: hypothetical protein MJB14_09550, partial [Spirochaetes bacterium]|nr:hypothetical protein [Spirochaetota bacterium]